MPDEVTTETATTVEEVTPEIMPLPQVILPQVTSASEFKRQARARWLITLPSGNVVKVHKAKWGSVFSDPRIDAGQILNFAATDRADVVKIIIPLARAIVPYIVEEPRIGNDDGAISIDDFDDFDLMALFAWARGASAPNLIVTEV